MTQSAISASLYADWQHRRNRLLESSSTPPDPWQEMLLKILDYLLHRYRDSAAAQQAARCASVYDLTWDDRRIVVHNHLGRGTVAGVKSRDEAGSRMEAVVRRMATDHAHGADELVPAELPRSVQVPVKVILAWRAIRRALSRGFNADDRILKAIALCPYLPRDLIQHLADRISDTATEDLYAVEMLLECQSPSLLPVLRRAWCERVARGLSGDKVRRRIEEILLQPGNRESTAEFMRESLADDNLELRIAATAWIARLGGLEDVGLLSDLLALTDSNQNEREHRALLDALTTLSQSTP